MTLTAREIGVCTCPNCGTEWGRDEDENWFCDEMDVRRDPLEGGRRFCPACALDAASYADHLRYITQDCKQSDFLRWVLAEDRDAVDCFRALLVPDADWLETRLAEFIRDECEDEFREWRCGA